MARVPLKRAAVAGAATVLVTGFASFGGDSDNPSWQAVALLRGKRIGGHRIAVRQLPVEFDASLKTLRAAIRETAPALVLCVGLAGNRSRMSIERIAINIDDARIPDNAGASPIDAAVVAGGPAAYFATLPIKAMLVALRKAGIPVEISQTAGTYVCNHVFYGLMHALRHRPRVRGGFIHVPYASTPGLTPEIMARGLHIAIATSLATSADLRIAAGAEH